LKNIKLNVLSGKLWTGWEKAREKCSGKKCLKKRKPKSPGGERPKRD